MSEVPSGPGRSTVTPSGPSPAVVGGAPRSAAAVCTMVAAKSCAASSSARPATTVPVEPKAPESCPTTSVSDCLILIRSTDVPSAVAAICECTVVVPLPNSAVPTDTVYVPSDFSSTVQSAQCPNGGTVSNMLIAMPSPTDQRGPGGGTSLP